MNIYRPTGTNGLLGAVLYCLALAVFVVAAHTQEPRGIDTVIRSKAPASPKPTPERPREIVTLLNDARLSAPELAADVFLHVIESKKVVDPAWRREIIDEAKRIIADVKRVAPVVIAFGNPKELNDTEEYIQAAVSRQNLDRLSFHSRLIKLVVETDPAEARFMTFQLGGDLGLTPRSCRDILIYSPDDMYLAVAKVAATSFTERQIVEGERALFLLPWVENLQSPTQILPAIRLTKQNQGSQAERQMLWNALSKSIDRNFSDDRSFTALVKSGDLSTQISRIVAENSDAAVADLAAAFRSMLRKNLGSRCSENAINKGMSLPAYIAMANKLFVTKPLAADEIVTTEVLGTAQPVRLLVKSTAAKSLREEGVSTMGHTILEGRIVKHDQTDAGWIGRLNGFVDKLLAFQGAEGETETELLMLKSSFLGAILVQSVEPGELHRSITTRYLRLLVASPLQKKDFGQWLFWVKDVEKLAGTDFLSLASEFPNQNIEVMLKMRKLGVSDNKNRPPQIRRPPGESR